MLEARWFGYLVGLAAVALTSAFLELLLPATRLGNASTLYAIPVLVTAALYGRGPALLASAGALVGFEYRQARLGNSPDWLTPVVFVVTALVAGQLAVMLRQQARQARQREREALAFYQVAQLVPASTLELEPLLGMILDQLRTSVGYDSAAVVLRDGGDEAVVFEYRGPLPRERVVGLHVQPGSAMGKLLEDAERRREPVMVQHVQGVSPLARDLAATGASLAQVREYEHSELAVPLIVKGQIIGVQTLVRSAAPAYTARDAELASVFVQHAAVAIENARLYGEVRDRLNELVGLQQLGATLLQEHDFDRVLQAICLQLQGLTEAEGVALALLNEGEGVFELRAAVGPDTALTLGARIPVEGSFAGEAVRTNRAQRSDDAQHDPRGHKPTLAAREATSVLSVPMRTRQRVVGAITIYNKQRRRGFTDRDAELATLFAQQAAVAIENARLYEEARGKAALEERQKLARELHDSVSQALYGIALNASAADELFTAAPDRARGLLRDVLGLAEAGLAELRALIFELRPESLEQEGLVGALEKQAAAIQARHGLDVRLEVAGEPELPHTAKEALFRVAQEALHNATKHARARMVELVLEQRDGEVALVVADDGRGFDPGGSSLGTWGSTPCVNGQPPSVARWRSPARPAWATAPGSRAPGRRDVIA